MMRVRNERGDDRADERDNLEAVTDAEYVEISPSKDYDGLMAHCKRLMSS